MFAEGFLSSRAGVLALASTIGLPAAVAAQSPVIVVNPGNANAIQNAVNAAGEGDTLLVKPRVGPYNPVTVVGKSLTIVFDSETGFGEISRIRVRDLGPDQSVVLTRLSARNSVAIPDVPIWLHDNQGRVTLVQRSTTSGT